MHNKFFPRPFFRPDDGGNPEGGEPAPAPAPEGGGEQFAYEGSYAGQKIQLTKAQLDRAVALGIVKAEELNKTPKKDDLPKEEPKKEEPKKGEEPNPLKEELDKLRQEIRANNDRASLKAAQSMIKVAKIPEEFREDIETNILSKYALSVHKNEGKDIEDIAAAEIKSWEARLSKFTSTNKIDVDKKLKDREDNKFNSPGSKTSQQEADKPLTRHDFRSGSLSKRVRSHIGKLLGEK